MGIISVMQELKELNRVLLMGEEELAEWYKEKYHEEYKPLVHEELGANRDVYDLAFKVGLAQKSIELNLETLERAVNGFAYSA